MGGKRRHDAGQHWLIKGGATNLPSRRGAATRATRDFAGIVSAATVLWCGPGRHFHWRHGRLDGHGWRKGGRRAGGNDSPDHQILQRDWPEDGCWGRLAASRDCPMSLAGGSLVGMTHRFMRSCHVIGRSKCLCAVAALDAEKTMTCPMHLRQIRQQNCCAKITVLLLVRFHGGGLQRRTTAPVTARATT